ncbi:MAG TPA: hypothetical protein VM537_25540 [Anaerolineae bacterium]|nr:hypothetical protein [Anaerolineae bacterium]
MLNGLISIGAIALALIYGTPGNVDVLSFDVSLEFTFYSVSLCVDPVILVWTDRNIPGAAMTFGNTIVAERWLEESPKRDWVLRYEECHVRQCQGLGWLMWPVSLFVEMDPGRHSTGMTIDYSHPEQAEEALWMPPDWMDSWHWIRLELRFG